MAERKSSSKGSTKKGSPAMNREQPKATAGRGRKAGTETTNKRETVKSRSK